MFYPPSAIFVFIAICILTPRSLQEWLFALVAPWAQRRLVKEIKTRPTNSHILLGFWPFERLLSAAFIFICDVVCGPFYARLSRTKAEWGPQFDEHNNDHRNFSSHPLSLSKRCSDVINRRSIYTPLKFKTWGASQSAPVEWRAMKFANKSKSVESKVRRGPNINNLARWLQLTAVEGLARSWPIADHRSAAQQLQWQLLSHLQ